jgi:hypothetical protein
MKSNNVIINLLVCLNLVLLGLYLAPFIKMDITYILDRYNGIVHINTTDGYSIKNLTFFIIVRFFIVMAAVLILLCKNQFTSILFVICSIPQIIYLAFFLINHVSTSIKIVGFISSFELYYYYILHFILLAPLLVNYIRVVYMNRNFDFYSRYFIYFLLALTIFCFLYWQSEILLSNDFEEPINFQFK